MDFEQGSNDTSNQKLEEMYENLTNITKQLAIIQGFMESKYGQEFTSFCQFSETSSTDRAYASVVDTTSIQEDTEEYDKMPNLISQESPSRTLGFVTVPLRQTASGSSKGSSSKLHAPVQASSSWSGGTYRRERNSIVKEEKTFEHDSENNDDAMMYPLHNFTDLLDDTEEDDTNETPEFLELELDPSTLLTGQPPALQPMFESTQQQHFTNSSNAGHSSAKRSSSRQSNSNFQRYDTDGTRVPSNSSNLAVSRRASVGSHENNISYKKFDCHICGIKFEFAETLKSHLESHAGSRNIRSNSDDQSTTVNAPNVVPLPRLMPRPSIPVPELLAVDIMQEQTVTTKASKSKKKRSSQMPASPTSSSTTESASGKKRRKDYNQARPCALKCPECDLPIRDRSRLIEHLRGHTGERPFECTHCERNYTRRDVLKTHMLKMHGIVQ